MKLSVELPDALAEQARNLAAREQTSLDALIAAALTVQLSHAPLRPTIAERAARADWARFDEIMARVPANPPLPGDEK
jgi:hypothetical protein